MAPVAPIKPDEKAKALFLPIDANGSLANLDMPSVKVWGAAAVALGTAEGAVINGEVEAGLRLVIPAFAESGSA